MVGFLNNMNMLKAKQAVDIAAHAMEMQAESFIRDYNHLDNKDFRHKSLIRLKKIGYPNTRHEEWKYTDLNQLVRESFPIHHNIDTQYNNDVIATIKKYIANTKIYTESNSEQCIVLLDGLFSKELSDLTVSINVIKSINDEKLKNTQETVNSIVEYINSCYLGGICVNITETNRVNNIRVLSVFTESVSGKIVNIKNKYIVSENAKLNLIEDFLYINDTGNSNFKFNLNVLTSIELKSGAICKHYIAQTNGENNYFITYSDIEQAKNSEYHSYNMSLGSKLARQDFNIHQNDDYAISCLNGILLANNKQHMDSHLKVHHKASHGKSIQNYRAVLSDRAHGVFNGMVFVAKNTIDNNASQSNKNILLSAHAEMNTKPELQIYADDVICSHGATIGSLDEDTLFYLQSRGIDEHSAKAILITSFLNHIVEVINDDAVLSWFKILLNNKLELMTGGEFKC